MRSRSKSPKKSPRKSRKSPRNECRKIENDESRKEFHIQNLIDRLNDPTELPYCYGDNPWEKYKNDREVMERINPIIMDRVIYEHEHLEAQGISITTIRKRLTGYFKNYEEVVKYFDDFIEGFFTFSKVQNSELQCKLERRKETTIET